MTTDITAILTTYRRPNSIKPFVEAIRGQSVRPTAIWAWANEPDGKMKVLLAAAKLDRVVSSTQNAYFHGRFVLALLTTTEFVAIFDDDTIPGNNWFANCLETMEKTPGILGTAGVVLHGEARRGKGDGYVLPEEPRGCFAQNEAVPVSADYAKRTMHGWQRPCDEAVEVDLVGQAWFLRTEWVKYLFSSPPVTGTNGEDIELAARAWRLAGIRSFCPPHPAGDQSRWGSTRGLELGIDEVAASLRVEHLAERQRIVEAEMAVGWRPLFMREGVVVGRVPSLLADKETRRQGDLCRERRKSKVRSPKSRRKSKVQGPKSKVADRERRGRLRLHNGGLLATLDNSIRLPDG